MRKFILTFIVVLTALSAFAAGFHITAKGVGRVFTNKYVFNGFGCSGDNVSPGLVWSGAPEGTKSFVISMYDPDAPTGSGWWHWVVADIPHSVTHLAEGAGNSDKLLPKGAVSIKTDFGSKGYGGPCPPPGKPHRYVISVFAMKVAKLGVPAGATPGMAGFMTRANAIDSASTVIMYGR